MTFNEIKEFTYIGDAVTIDGVSFQIETTLDSEFDAVQYHKGRNVLEEPLMVEAEESKYQYAIDEWVEAKRISEIPVVKEIPDITITKVTMRQARLALLQSELLTAVETAIVNGTDEAMKIEWEYATEVRRDWASLIALTTELGLTSLQLDDLFILADTL
jgi:hypothetical protein